MPDALLPLLRALGASDSSHQIPATPSPQPSNTLLAHIFIPWSVLPHGEPPTGAKALCGHVAGEQRGESVGRDHPDACKVCTALWEGM